MPGDWTVFISDDALESLARLRRVAGLSVLVSPTGIWLVGPPLDEQLDARLRAIPGGRRFHVLPDRQLIPAGSRVPNGCLPDGKWTPLADWLQVERDTPRWPGRFADRVTLRLVRSDSPENATVLLTAWTQWSAYVANAPQIRLDRWSFASDGSRVIVRGDPLPPLAGTRFVERDGIAVEAGWHWSPPVDAAVLRTAAGLTAGDLLLWSANSDWEHIPADSFVRASRSAV